MKAEISYDLVMDEDMDFVEGTFRLPGCDWQVFVFSQSEQVSELQIKASTWDSGVTGLSVRFPKGDQLCRRVVETVLGDHLGVNEWIEVQGPDSIVIR